MTSTVEVSSHGNHCLIQAYDVKGPGERTLMAEQVVDPGDVESVQVWGGREVVVTEIRADHPLVTGQKPPVPVSER
jgi:hypothetical protein